MPKRWWPSALPSLCALLSLISLGAGCEPTDEMNPASVTSLPDGDALGSAASGTYQITVRTDSCAGPCQYYSPLYGKGYFCEIGEQTVKAKVEQTDGHLELRGSYLNPGMRITLLAGGIDSGGHFEVGGARNDETPTATMRLEGAFGAAGITATGRGRLPRGEIGECVGVYRWSGPREQ